MDDLYELPHQVFDALKHALVCLSFEELPREDVPPRRIWHDVAALNDHFEKVRARRKREAEHPSDAHFDDPVDNAAVKDLLID